MWPYWLIFLMPVLGLVAGRRLAQPVEKLFFLFFFIIVSFFVGMRFETGGDWFNYLRSFRFDQASTVGAAISGGDPGYHLLSVVVGNLGGGLVTVNLICAAFALLGVARFSYYQPLPWLSVVVAVPYLIIVVSMGYARQAVALGFILVGLVALSNGNIRRFLIWTLLGAAFHKSAVLLLPVAALASSQHRIWNMIWVGVISVVGGYLFLFDSVGSLWTNYVDADYESQGGLVRVLMNSIPALFYLISHRRLELARPERRLWWWMSIFALVCIPLVMISSTATDRVALYFIPVQLFVFSHLPFITKNAVLRAYIVVAVILYYAIVQAVWLFFASHAHAWLPYQMYPFAS